MNGWICLHRSITDHWIWEDPEKLKWWLDILICANSQEAKVNIGLDIIECKRGDVIRSLSGWAERWRVSKGCARNFIDLLFKDGMIERENLTKTTRITICNYDTYQSSAHDSKTLEKRTVNARRTLGDPNNNNNKDNNITSITLPNGNVVGLPAATPRTLSYEERCKKFIDTFNSLKVINKKPAKFQVTGLVRTKLKARLSTYSPEQIIGAIKNAMLDKNHIEKNWIYLTPEYILREEIIERYINADMSEKKEVYIPGAPASNDHTRFEPVYNPQD